MNQNRILGEVSEKIELIVALVFENYKSLDESLPPGMADVFRPATGVAAPALSPALKLYSLLNDILSPEGSAVEAMQIFSGFGNYLPTYFLLKGAEDVRPSFFSGEASYFCTSIFV